MSWRLIENAADLAEVTAAAHRARAVVLDTEFIRRRTYHPQVALVQLCIPGGAGEEGAAALVDPLAIGDPAPLASLLADTGVLKVLHSASEDLEVFRHWLGVLPEPLFDTQRAAAFADIGFGLGYRTLVEQLLGVDLPKGETCSDWLQRPLTAAQCDYAALDVIHLLPLWRELERRLGGGDKLEWVLSDGADAVAAAARGGGDYYARIKGAGKLDQRQLGALAALCEWREETARRLDKPRGWIIDDRACLALARRLPTDPGELPDIPELPASARRRYGEQWLAVLRAQRDRQAEDLPPALPAPLDAEQRQRLQRLKAQRQRLARELCVAPEVVLQARDLELLVHESEGSAITEPAHWRARTVLDPLRDSLSGVG